MRLTLLHFNDLHGRLDQLPRLFTLIQRERAEARARGHAVLLLDGGDSSDRGVWESDITKGRANFALLEAMGVQASVVGNGEALQWGRAAFDRLVAAARDHSYGAKLTGAGGGGSMVALTDRPAEAVRAIEAAGGRAFTVLTDPEGGRRTA